MSEEENRLRAIEQMWKAEQMRACIDLTDALYQVRVELYVLMKPLLGFLERLLCFLESLLCRKER